MKYKEIFNLGNSTYCYLSEDETELRFETINGDFLCNAKFTDDFNHFMTFNPESETKPPRAFGIISTLRNVSKLAEELNILKRENDDIKDAVRNLKNSIDKLDIMKEINILEGKMNDNRNTN